MEGKEDIISEINPEANNKRILFIILSNFGMQANKKKII